jgi:hypothetical protein
LAMNVNGLSAISSLQRVPYVRVYGYFGLNHGNQFFAI